MVTASATKVNDSKSSEKESEDVSEEHDEFEKTATKKFKLCPIAFQNLIIMCRVGNKEDDMIPSFWSNIAQANATTQDKLNMARNHLEKNVIWREAKVPPMYHLLSMIVNQKFEEETSLNTIKSASQGLTPFAVPYLTENEVEDLNERSTALVQASLTTVGDHMQGKIKARAPTTFEGLLLNIKMFGNVLFAFFGHRCPLFVEIQELLDDLHEYSENARRNTSKKTLATIMWILHLQSRYFSSGQMDGSKRLIAPYKYMITCVRTTAPVHNGDVPEEFYNANKDKKDKQKVPPANDYANRHMNFGGRDGSRMDRYDRNQMHMDYRGNDFGVVPPRFNNGYYNFGGNQRNGDMNGYPPYKRQRVDIVDLPNYHPKIMDAVKVLRGRGRLPRIQDICKACNVNQDALFGQSEICVKGTLFGTCFASCPRSHEPISDAEADAVLAKIKPVLQNPQILQVNK